MWKTKGFSLIELIVTIAVVGILASAVVTLIGQSSRQYSRDAKRRADLEQLRSALELYRNDQGGYPSNLDSLRPNFITTVPTDQTAGRNYSYQGTPSGCSGSGCTSYNLCAALEKVTSPAATPCAPCGATCTLRVTSP